MRAAGLLQSAIALGRSGGHLRAGAAVGVGSWHQGRSFAAQAARKLDRDAPIDFQETYASYMQGLRQGAPTPKRYEVVNLVAHISTREDLRRASVLLQEYAPHNKTMRKDMGKLMIRRGIKVDALDDALTILKNHRVYRFMPAAVPVLELMEKLAEEGRVKDVLAAHKVLTMSDPEAKKASHWADGNGWHDKFLVCIAGALCEAGEFQQAARTFASFRDNGVEIGSAAYKAVFDACLSAAEDKPDEVLAAVPMIEELMLKDGAGDAECKNQVSTSGTIHPCL
jgi:hypothetical protein